MGALLAELCSTFCRDTVDSGAVQLRHRSNVHIHLFCSIFVFPVTPNRRFSFRRTNCHGALVISVVAESVQKTVQILKLLLVPSPSQS